MKKRLLSLLICLMVAVSTVSFVACGSSVQDADIALYEEGMSYTVSEKGEPVPVYSLSYEIMGGDDVMPIGGYFGLYHSGGSLDGTSYPNHVSDEAFATMAEMGINMVVYVPNRATDLGLYKKWYELGEKYGIGLFANSLEFELKVGTRTEDPRNKEGYVAPTEEWLYDLVKRASQDFQYKSFLGLWAMDETYANHQLATLAELIPMFYNCGLPEGIDAYCNGLGYWEGKSNVSNTFTGGGWTFEEYMFTGKSGTHEVGGKVVSYDIPCYLAAGFPMLSGTEYPVPTPEEGQALDDEAYVQDTYEKMSTWFQNYSRLVNIAYEQEIPYWRMMQAGAEFYKGDPDLPYYPTEGTWMLDAYSALAFGAKALQYYELSGNIGHNTDNDGTHDYGRNGMVGADGKRNLWWYYGKNLATQVQAIDHVLMNAHSVGILPHGEQATALIGELDGQLITTKGWRQLKQVRGDDCFLGCFDYKGGTALMVVNSSIVDDANVSLRFDDKYLYTVTQRGEAVDVVGTSIPLTLSPGEGVMIVLH